MSKEKMEKKAIKRLEKEFKKIPEEKQEVAEFFTDISSDESYAWTFKIEGKITRYNYMFETGEIVKSTI
ncbi:MULTISPECIES: hypothetical protein [Bacillaceae]|uniref:Ubiquitin-protein ligase n=1 Tax=Cytobacillus purgationiresistens TaxID=863449 RepID=A0ABU0AJU0_9BACI|nr:hypothetical protein [Cytobacillus purgationiresistens]MDQ0271144.1 ubiquitin-protein ligase [Cytobacillus purgationiresistens]